MLASQLFTFSNARGGANCVTSGQAHLCGHALTLEETWLSVSALIHPQGGLSGGGQDCVRASQLHPDSHPVSHPGLQGLWFAHGCTAMLEEEGTSSKQFLQSREHGIVQNVSVR